MLRLQENVWGKKINHLSEEDKKQLLDPNSAFGKSKEILRKVYPTFGYSGSKKFKVQFNVEQIIKEIKSETYEVILEADCQDSARRLALSLDKEDLIKDSRKIDEDEYEDEDFDFMILSIDGVKND